MLDEVYAAITNGAGHLLDIVDVAGNPISTSAGAAALFPGDTLQIVFDWRNSCGDYVAVAFQVDVTNVGSAETGIPYPKCDSGTDGTFELFDDSRILERQTDGRQPEGTCRATNIRRVSYPYPTALEALAAELDALATGSAFDEFEELSGLTTNDFLATLRTDKPAGVLRQAASFDADPHEQLLELRSAMIATRNSWGALGDASLVERAMSAMATAKRLAIEM